jgi:NADH-quinone oxidoreductase subunit J
MIAQPEAVLLLCVMAGIGTILLLPNRRSPKLRKFGAALMSLALIIFGLHIAHQSAGRDQSGAGVYFWIFSAIAIVSAVRVITHPRPVYSALYFILTVFASAGLFVLMYAEFMAAALVFIYAGAILITYVFVIMLASSAQSGESTGPLAGLAECDIESREPFFACCIGFALMGILLFMIFDKSQGLQQPPGALPEGIAAAAPADEAVTGDAFHGSTQSLGHYLFQSQLVNLELSGLILTVAMVGAIVIARRRVLSADEAFEPSSETITADMTPLDDSPHSIPVYGTTNPKQKAYPQN